MKILVSKLRALGDTVLFTSTVEILKKRFPEAKITVLLPQAYSDVFLCNPHITNLWSFEGRGYLGWIREIRRQKFDYFIDFHSADRTNWLGRLSGAKAHFSQFHDAKEEQRLGKKPNALEWDVLFLNRWFKGESFSTVPPKIYLTELERAWGRDFWRKKGADPQKVVFFGLGASRPTKIWPLEHFARFAELLRDRMELVPAIIFGPGEEEAFNAAKLVDYLRVKGFRPQNSEKDTGGGVIFQTGLSVRQLACVLSTCGAYVGNDSGPKHMSVALGIPTFTLFGPEDPTEWHPYSRDEHPLFFIPALSCRTEDSGRWCGVRECVEEKHRCMRNIDPMDVFEVFQKKVTA